MGGRERLAAIEPPFDPSDVAIDDADVLELLEPVVQEWWTEQFGEFVPDNGGFFTPPQKEAIPLIHERENALIAAPTGSGKTLASFTGIINGCSARPGRRTSKQRLLPLRLAPLKSLANDIHRNLEVPPGQHHREVRRPGRGRRDSPRHPSRRHQRFRAVQDAGDDAPHPQHDPETLAILLNSPKFREKLRTVEYVVVDEIHSLAENKRGTHLSVSLERLEAMAHVSPTRIGCSATVEPLSTMAEYLVGCEVDQRETSEVRAGAKRHASRQAPSGARVCERASGGRSEPPRVGGATTESAAGWANGSEATREPRDYEIVDARFAREFDVELTCPTDDLINTPRDVVQGRFYCQLHDLIQRHTNTLVFTNTRSGAERVLHNLREDYDSYDEDNSGCHHGSLSKDRRQEIEEQLKEGSLDVVTTSTSLELGIDMPHIDLVVQVGSPKVRGVPAPAHRPGGSPKPGRRSLAGSSRWTATN